MIVARLTNKVDVRDVIEVRLDNDYKADCLVDLDRLDKFLDRVSLDVATSLVNKEGIKASADDVNDAIFGEVFGRKGLRTSLIQSSRGENKDRVVDEDIEENVNGVIGLLKSRGTGKMYVNGKLISGKVDKKGFVARGVVVRVKDLVKEKLGLECGKWVRLEVGDKYDFEIVTK